MTWIIGGVMLVSFVGGMVFWSKRMGQDLSPRGLQSMQRRNFYLMLFMVLLMSPMLLKQKGYFPIACWGVVLATGAYGAFRRPSAKEIQINYALDGQRCGQCEYDLTGNTSGVCPECGWEIPREIPVFESRTWQMWWQRWDIDHLDNWRKTLAGLLVGAIGFAGLGGFFMWTGFVPGMIAPLLMAAMFAINGVRVVAYAQRVQQKSVTQAHSKEAPATPFETDQR